MLSVVLSINNVNHGRQDCLNGPRLSLLSVPFQGALVLLVLLFHLSLSLHDPFMTFGLDTGDFDLGIRLRLEPFVVSFGPVLLAPFHEALNVDLARFALGTPTARSLTSWLGGGRRV